MPRSGQYLLTRTCANRILRLLKLPPSYPAVRDPAWGSPTLPENIRTRIVGFARLDPAQIEEGLTISPSDMRFQFTLDFVDCIVEILVELIVFPNGI